METPGDLFLGVHDVRLGPPGPPRAPTNKQLLMTGHSAETPSTSTKGKGIEVSTNGEEKVYHNPKSQVKLEQPLIDRVSEGHPSPERQNTLDKSIQDKLKAHRDQLKSLQKQVDEQVREAFQKQSSNYEAKKTDKESKSSGELMQELASMKDKVHRHHQNKDALQLVPEINQARSALVSCFKRFHDQPLKCTNEVDNFKKVVRNLESKFVVSMQ